MTAEHAQPNTRTERRSIVVERDIPHPPEKIWRALTQPHLMGEWLMESDFRPVVGHRFDMQAEWGAVDGEVLAVETHRTLSYSWNSDSANANGLESVVTWTLTRTQTGTHLRMEQSGFGPEQERAYRGARAGWPQLLAAMEQALARMD